MGYTKRTKIVATIGPVSVEKETLKKMLHAGLSVARLNFSHGDHSWHKTAIDNIRAVSAETGLPLAILADLQGPRIRTLIESPVEVSEGDEVVFHEQGASLPEGKKAICIDYPGIIPQLKKGQRILIEDGKYAFEVTAEGETSCMTTSLRPGVVQSRKGVNFFGANFALSSLTEKDKKDLEFVLGEKVDFIGLSFVGNRANIEELRELMRPFVVPGEYEPEVIVKVEREEAIRNIDEILDATDAVMIARGDLATEMGITRITVLQKDLERRCLLKTKPFIVATQMLESMMASLQPTRADISDISNAVIDHTDATMLSGETAGGKYPLECVETMAEAIRNIEESELDDINEPLRVSVESNYLHVMRGVYHLSRIEGVSALLVTTHSGYTARLLSHFRPRVPIYAVTSREDVYQKMNLLWGVTPYLMKEPKEENGNRDERPKIRLFEERLVAEGLLKDGDQIVSVFRNGNETTKTVELRERGI